MKKPDCGTLLEKYSVKEMEMELIEYIMYLRNQGKVSPSTIRVYTAAPKPTHPVRIVLMLFTGCIASYAIAISPHILVTDDADVIVD
jgi:hypothetical protein